MGPPPLHGIIFFVVPWEEAVGASLKAIFSGGKSENKWIR